MGEEDLDAFPFACSGRQNLQHVRESLPMSQGSTAEREKNGFEFVRLALWFACCLMYSQKNTCCCGRLRMISFGALKRANVFRVDYCCFT